MEQLFTAIANRVAHATGKPITFIVGEGFNHFEIQETLASPYGLLGHEVLKLMKLG